jgi:hypothetical protein
MTDPDTFGDHEPDDAVDADDDVPEDDTDEPEPDEPDD